MGKKQRVKQTSDSGNTKQPPPHKATAACQSAIAAYEKEDYSGALEAIKNREPAYRNNIFYLHADAFLDYKLATKNEDAETVRSHLQGAAKSAYESWTLCGNSIVLAHFCVSMLHILANFNRDYERVIEEGERALAMRNLKDPGKDDFIFKDLSQGMNVKQIIQELRVLVQQCKKKKEWIGFNRVQRFHEKIRAIEERLSANNISSLRSELEERRKRHASKNFRDNLAKIQKVMPFWNGKLSEEAKRNLFKVKVEDLKSHLDKVTDGTVTDHVLEVIKYSKRWKRWKYWECCQCRDLYIDWQSYKDHLYNDHIWNVNPFTEFIPDLVDDASVEIITKGEWKPVHISDRHKNIVQQFLFGSDSYEDVSAIAATHDPEGPLCGDGDLTGLLEEVRGMLRLLVEHKCFFQCHFNTVIYHSFEMLRARVPDLVLYRDMQNLKVICFLDYVELQNILHYLQIVFNNFGLSGNHEKGNSLDETLSKDIGFDIEEKVVLTEDFSCLILDEQSLGEEPNLVDNYGSVTSDGFAITSANSVQGDGESLVSKKILPCLWLYAGKNFGTESESWECTRQSQKRQAEELFNFFREERSCLADYFQGKWMRVKKLEAVRAALSLCADTREQGPDNLVQTSASRLRRRIEELEEGNVNDVNSSDQFELDFLLNILEIDQNVNAYQIENLILSDSCLQENIKEWKWHWTSDIQVDDAIIMRCVGVLKQYSLMLGQVSAYDSRSIILPALKSFIQSRLEDLVHKNESQESEPKMDPLLKKHDTEKKIDEECDNKRQAQGKSTDKDTQDNAETSDERKPHEEEYKKQDESAAKKTGIEEKNETMVESTGENIKWVSDINPSLQEDDNVKRLQADIRKAARLSLVSFENYNGTLPADVKDGTMLRSDVYQYVIMQSQWRLQQLQDRLMSRCEMHPTFNGDLCFLCALLGSLAAMRIASRDEPKEAFAHTPSIKLPIDHFIGESPVAHFIAELNKQDQVDEGATEIDSPESASELENRLVVIVWNIQEVLEQERPQQEAEKKDLSEEYNGRG